MSNNRGTSGTSFNTNVADKVQNYTFTDFSPGFLAKAAERFSKDAVILEFLTLNIEEDPLAQGFQAESFDLIVCANVLHATRSMQETVAHCRCFLKLGGKLVLSEVTIGGLGGICQACWIGPSVIVMQEHSWSLLPPPTLFMGRIMQACSGSAAWIIGFATLADKVGQEHMGKVLGLAMSFVTAGTTLGPVVSGALLQLAGYWTAWSAPLVLLALDSMARMLMLEKENADEEPTTSNEERASLLASTRPEFEMPDQPSHVSIIRLYGVLISDARIITGLLNTFAFSVILSGFDATLPLHLQDVFGWNSLPIGHPWAGSEGYGEAIFTGGIVGIGAASPLVRGAGMFQLTGLSPYSSLDKQVLMKY
ncbi:amine transporter [Aspergillus fumigatus Z5]|nr:amine transporter [Aspergillus fumigatus Z5]